MTDLQILLLTILAGLLIGFISYILKFLRSIFPQSQISHEKTAAQEPHAQLNGDSSSAVNQVQKKQTSVNSTVKKSKNRQLHNVAFSHSWLMTSLKGHSGPVRDMDYSSNGKYLATCSTDRSVLIWPTKLFSAKCHNPIRGNVAYDEATKIRWSPDGRAFLVHKALADQLEVYKLVKKPESDGGGLSVSAGTVNFGVKHNECSEVVAIDLASNGKFIMSCSSTTDLVLYDLKGEVLHKIDSCLMQTYSAKISPNSRFVAACGFTPDVKFWEVKVTKSGDVERVKRAFELTGHTSGILGFAFNADSTRVATISKDGTWRLYNIDVEFERGQDPGLVCSGQHGFDLEVQHEVRIALSPDAKIIAASCGQNITFFDTTSKTSVATLSNVHTDPITKLIFDDEGAKLLSCGDKHIRVFHNVPGMHRNLEDFESELKVAKTDGLKTRLKDQIKLLRENIESIKA